MCVWRRGPLIPQRGINVQALIDCVETSLVRGQITWHVPAPRSPDGRELTSGCSPVGPPNITLHDHGVWGRKAVSTAFSSATKWLCQPGQAQVGRTTRAKAVGRPPAGHPTTLTGSPSDISYECADIVEKGCYGADLLAFRSIDSDPIELVKVARKSLNEAYLLVAGDIDSIERIEEVFYAGARGFTVGSAIFNCKFSDTEGFIENLSLVQNKTNNLNRLHGADGHI